jgi:hypothetical protein
VNNLLRLGLALSQGATMQQQHAAEQSVRRSGYIVAAGRLAVVGLGCLLVGLWLAAAPLVGVAGATLFVALILAGLSGGALLLSRRPRDRAPIASGDLGAGLALEEFTRGVAANKGTMLLAAALAGVVLAHRDR